MTDSTPAETDAETMTADAPAPEQEAGWSPNPSRRRIVVAVGAILLGVLVALFAWGLPPFAGGDETTNNAYVRGRTTVVSPQVAGYLVEVPVADFQRVEKGELLARIDDAPFQQKLQQGAANAAAQQATLANSAQSLRSARAQLELQDAAVAAARAGLQQAQAGVRQAQAQRAIAAENVRSVTVGRGALEAQVAGAEASKGLAEFELSRTEIRAPRAGRLSEVSARVGQLVTAGTQLMYIVPDDLWVVANFKETQTANMAVGQRATLEIDALGGLELTGRVQSIAPAASSEFSLVKPDTGAGNFVKVPQRIAVRIVLDKGQDAAQRLGPGMSVVATVHTED